MAKTLGKAIIPIKNGGDVGLIGNFKDSVSFLYYPSLDKNDALYKERYKYWKSELDKAVLSNDTYYQELNKERFRIEKMMLQRSIDIFDNIVI